MISVTLQFPDALAASHALARMAAPEQFATATLEVFSPPAPAVIAHEDRPDVGAPTPQPVLQQPALPDPAAAAFGGAVAQAAPLVAPTAQPASIAPSAAAAPTAAPAVEHDSTGLPWDGRIHASTKTKTATGVWTAKRNVPADLKAQVEADLRGVPLAQTPPAATALPPAAPPAPAAPQAPQPPAADPMTFAEVAAAIGGFFAGPNAAVAQASFTNALASQGLQHIAQLVGAPQAVQPVWAEFKRLMGL